MSPVAAPVPAQRPRETGGGSQIALGVLLIVFGGLLMGGGVPLLGLPWMLCGVALILGRVRRMTFGAASQALAGSYHAIGRGALAEAEALLAGVEGSRFAWVGRIADIQRAIICLRRGDVAAARDRLDAALARPVGLFAQANSAYQIEAALGLRAFARASLGDYDGARRDAEAVRARPGASAESLARVSLAEAIALDRTGDRDALRALLERDKGLLLESCHPRERAIVRAYQRMLKVATASVYRKSAPREVDASMDEPPLVDWVAKVAPAAAPFVRVPRQTHLDGPLVPALQRATDAAHRAIREARAASVAATSRPRLLRYGLTGAAALALLYVAGAAISASGAGGPGAAVGTFLDELPLLLPLVLAGGFVGGGGVLAGLLAVRRLRPAPRGALARLSEARAAVGRGDLDGASATLAHLAESHHDLVAAQARALEAAIAERRGDAAAILRACDAGLGRLARLRPAYAAPLRTELASQRAFALAALDRVDEASAELGSLLATPYPMQGRDLFRVRLVELVRGGHYDAAARWVEQGALDLPLGVRDELLADLTRAIAAPESAGLGEIERLKDEFRTSPENKRWIEAVAPGLIARFTGAVEGDGDAPAVRIATDDDAERDHLAEIEAASAERAAAHRAIDDH